MTSCVLRTAAAQRFGTAHTISLRCNHLFSDTVRSTVLLKMNVDTFYIFFERVSVLLITRKTFKAHNHCILKTYPDVRDCQPKLITNIETLYRTS
jgi:hypothetical protein